MELKVEYIAKCCHEANRIWCQANGDESQKHWEDAEQWQRDSAIKGVHFVLDNPDATASSQHDYWSAVKIADGWVFGEVKDAEAKTHPCLVPFEELPFFQQKKDKLFKAIVSALK
ncbi:MAG: RyR domain-containing protein [Bacteroidota bacterium]